MSKELFSLMRTALTKGHKGIVKKYLDRRIEAFTYDKDVSSNIRPFADKMIQFAKTVRKVADLDESLALTCLEDGYDITEWILQDVGASLDRIRNTKA